MQREVLDALIHRWTEEAIVDGRLDVFDELLAEDVVDRTGPVAVTGRSSFKARAQAIRAAFADISLTVDDVITNGDRVAWRWTLEGTHAGTFAGVPATMTRVAIRGVNFQTLADDRVVEHWSLVDIFGPFQALRPRSG